MMAVDDAADPARGALFRPAAALVLARAAGSLLVLGWMLVAARLLGTGGFGALMAVWAWAMLGSAALGLNLEFGAIRYLTRDRAAGRADLVSGFVRANLGVVGLSGAVLATLAGGAVALGLPVPGALWPALGLAVTAAASRATARQAAALGYPLRGQVPVLLLRPALALSALLVFAPATPTLALWLLVAAHLGALAAQGGTLRGRLGARAAPRFEWRRWLRHGAMGAPMMLLRDHPRHLVVAGAALVLPVAETGRLALAFSLVAPLLFAVKSVDAPLGPALSRALHSGQVARAVARLDAAARIRVAVATGGAALLALGAPVLLDRGFGAGFAPAYLPMLALLALPLAEAAFGPAPIVLNVMGRRAALLRLGGLGAALLALAGIIGAVAPGGAAGAGASAALAYLAQQGFLRRESLASVGVDTLAPMLRHGGAWRGRA